MRGVTEPKRNGKVPICVHLTKMNASVCTETYPLPKIDALLGEIGDSYVFSKLDANSGLKQSNVSFSPLFGLLFHMLFPTTSFLLEISTRTISEKNRAWKV